MQGITAKIDAEKAKYVGTMEGNRIVADVWKTEADVLLGEANLNVQQLIKSADLNQEALKTIAAIEAQLAAAAMSVLSISKSASASHSYNKSLGYSAGVSEQL